MKMHDKFIESYKELEGLVREKYESVRAYEEQLPDEDSKKLQICRIVRNYIQHNADYEKFIQVSPGMQTFVDDLIYELHCQNGVLKDHMLSVAKYGCVFKVGDTVSESAAMLDKKQRDFGFVVNTGGEIIGLLTKSVISTAFGMGLITGATKIAKINHLLDKNYVVKFLPVTSTMDFVNSELSDNPNTMIICVNKAGTFMGVYNV